MSNKIAAVGSDAGRVFNLSGEIDAANTITGTFTWREDDGSTRTSALTGTLTPAGTAGDPDTLTLATGDAGVLDWSGTGTVAADAGDGSPRVVQLAVSGTDPGGTGFTLNASGSVTAPTVYFGTSIADSDPLAVPGNGAVDASTVTDPCVMAQVLRQALLDKLQGKSVQRIKFEEQEVWFHSGASVADIRAALRDAEAQCQAASGVDAVANHTPTRRLHHPLRRLY
jgi:hypothetical protein